MSSSRISKKVPRPKELSTSSLNDNENEIIQLRNDITQFKCDVISWLNSDERNEKVFDCLNERGILLLLKCDKINELSLKRAKRKLINDLNMTLDILEKNSKDLSRKIEFVKFCSIHSIININPNSFTCEQIFPTLKVYKLSVLVNLIIKSI